MRSWMIGKPFPQLGIGFGTTSLQGELLSRSRHREGLTYTWGVSLQIKIDKRFKKNVAGVFGRYDFEVGILEDAQYKKPLRGERGLKGQDVLSSYAGGPVRKKSRLKTNVTISEVSKANRERMGVNYLTEPFQKRTSDIVRFTNEFFKLAFGRTEKKRAENLLQAIVRNPILRGDYGSNSALTKTIKGFDRYMIDTAQLFKAIKAKVNRRGDS